MTSCECNVVDWFTLSKKENKVFFFFYLKYKENTGTFTGESTRGEHSFPQKVG